MHQLEEENQSLPSPIPRLSASWTFLKVPLLVMISLVPTLASEDSGDLSATSELKSFSTAVKRSACIDLLKIFDQLILCGFGDARQKGP